MRAQRAPSSSMGWWGLEQKIRPKKELPRPYKSSNCCRRKIIESQKNKKRRSDVATDNHDASQQTHCDAEDRAALFRRSVRRAFGARAGRARRAGGVRERGPSARAGGAGDGAVCTSANGGRHAAAVRGRHAHVALLPHERGLRGARHQQRSVRRRARARSTMGSSLSSVIVGR